MASRVLELAGSCRSLAGAVERLLGGGVDPCTGMSLVSHCIAARVLYRLGVEPPGGLLSPAITEPRGGSDPSAVETSAKLLGGSALLTGEKVFATNALYASAILVFARSSGGYVLALLEPGAPGLEAEPLDLEVYTCSGIARLRLASAEARLAAGPGIEPYRAVLAALAESRVLVAALAIGLARRLLQEALSWALDRGVYRHQAVRHRLARAHAWLEAAAALTEKAAASLDDGGIDWSLASAAKYTAVEASIAAGEAAARTLGGHAARKATGVYGTLLHLYALEPAEGTGDIQLEIIARSLERKASPRGPG